MFGAILGDIIGSPYEFDCNNIKTKDFPLFSQKSHQGLSLLPAGHGAQRRPKNQPLQRPLPFLL